MTSPTRLGVLLLLSAVAGVTAAVGVVTAGVLAVRGVQAVLRAVGS